LGKYFLIKLIAIEEAKRRGFLTLKLYSSSDKNERDAFWLYLKFDFSFFREMRKELTR